MKKVLPLIITSLLVLLLTGCSTTSNTTTSPVVGDWEYTGTIDGKTYDITLELENNDHFSFEVDENSAAETIDSEAEGTYTVNDDTLTFSIITVKDKNGYFDNTEVENGQLEFKYEMSNNGNSMTLKNVSSVIQFIPDDLTLTREN